MPELDIIIPVYNEGDSIVATLRAIERDVKTAARVHICYDFDEDDTMAAIEAEPGLALDIASVKNRARGPHGAVMSGIAAGSAPYVLVFPADDDYNTGMLDAMVERAREGCDIVCASRFIPGGGMTGCPALKAAMVRGAAFTLYWLAGVPSRDATNGFRLFSRAFLDRVAVDSDQGFTYSLELLVKCHRLGGRVAEVPARWFERKAGTSRFRVLKWAPAYLRWYRYAFATTYLRRKDL